MSAHKRPMIKGLPREVFADLLKISYEIDSKTIRGLSRTHGLSTNLVTDLLKEAGTKFRSMKESRHLGQLTNPGFLRNMRKGEDHPAAKLTTQQVIEIKQALKNDASKVELAKKYGVHRESIHRIDKGQGWAHVQIED